MQNIIDNIFYIEMSKEAIFDSAKYIIDTKSDEGLIIIDPGLYIKFFSELIENKLNPRDINHCLITHAHLDHYGACYKLKENNSKIKFYVHDDDVDTFEKIADPELLKDYYPGYEFSPVKASYKVRNNQVLTFGDLEIKCLHTPGHSPGASAYYIEIDESKILIAGDIGGSALEHSGGNIEDYIKSMHKLIDIEPDILCEGHEGPIRPKEKAEEFIKNCITFNQLLQKAVEVNPLDTSIWYNLAMQVYELKDYGFALDVCNYLLEIDPLNKEGSELKKLINKHKPPKVEFIKTILKKREKYLQAR
jgi:glyoxylase-like metal-dependent hydrolase (beta-lactamase superfamily II)